MNAKDEIIFIIWTSLVIGAVVGIVLYGSLKVTGG